MKRAVFAVVATVAGLFSLLHYKSVPVSSALTATGGAGSATGSGVGSETGGSGTTSRHTSSSTGSTRSATGRVVDTQYGPVQVKVVETSGRISNVVAVQLPEGSPYDQQVDQIAVPQLRQEAISANSAKLDVVSGATYTSQGYAESLQSALDALNQAA